jgi:trehalose/maltose hydrolase-like predicted phosphorylase
MEMPGLIETFMPTDDPRWLIEVDGFDPRLEATVEAVCAQVNGYLGTRAALEEGSAASRPSTFLAGVFDTPAAPQNTALPAPISEMVVAPDWTRLRITLDGAPLQIGAVELLEQRRVLDMRQGALLREWRVRDAAGRVTRLRSLRFASLDNRHLCVHTVAITPENYSGMLRVESLVDGRVTNENNTRHLEPAGADRLDAGLALAMRTSQSGYLLAYAAHAELRVGGTAASPDLVVAPDHVGWVWEAPARPGALIELRKVVAIVTSRESETPESAAADKARRAAESGLETLFTAHVAAWAARWRDTDIQLDEPGIQRETRFALYHLIGAANPDDERASIGARALTGERYLGHYFWDCEIFVWPALLYTHPASARAILMYRYHTLGEARAKARALGYQGAMFAWEATDTGVDWTPPYIINPAGEKIPVLTGVEEIHITADIAYAIWQYWQATGDEAFFWRYGAPMLLEIAAFWASRAEPDGARYHLSKVIGPDEYHETVTDNAYTNQLAAWCLRIGLAVADSLRRSGQDPWRHMLDTLQISDATLAAWRRIADGLVTGDDPPRGLIEQFRGYFALRDYDLTGHDPAVATLDVKLGWAALQSLQAIKQPDVVMLNFLLWEQFSPAARAANFRYYEPRTTHDSSLSVSIHALVAARLGDLPMAERYLRRAAQIDLNFANKGWAGAAGGVHIAALGGMWQALVLGFLGMRPTPDGLRFEPHVPPQWGTLSAPVQWRGRRLRITASAAAAEIALEAGAPLAVAWGDGPWQQVAPGQPLRRPA